MSSRRDTIAAIATPPGRGSIGVIRVSGASLGHFVEALTGRSLVPRVATVAPFRTGQGALIDQGLALYFAAPESYTGDDVLELQGHGGPVVLRSVLERCLELGARLAEPGEFTRRAFLNGKLDLTQAEAVIDLIDSATTQAARCAVRSLHGDFSSEVRVLADAIVEVRAHIEATLDFPEEEIAELDRSATRERLEGISAAVQRVLAAAKQGNMLREGLHVVLAGRPNVGKSSLLNRLAGAELAIVTDVPGTTRDSIRQGIELSGVPLHLIDTAGLRDTADVVERVGIERAWTAIAKSDVILQIIDAQAGVTCEDDALVERFPPDLPLVRVMNKIDLTKDRARAEHTAGGKYVWVSAKTGEGVDNLRRVLLDQAGWDNQLETAFLARERHMVALRRAASHLTQASEHLMRWELLAEELRLAQQQLATIMGEYTSDDLLGEIFSRFCIGK